MLIKMQSRCVVAMQLPFKKSNYNKLILIEHRFKVGINRLKSKIVL